MSKDWIVMLTEKEQDIWWSDIDCENRKEAIRLGREQAKEDGLKSFYIGSQTMCSLSTIYADNIIEDAQEQLYDNVGEVAETYLEGVTKEQQKELEDKLNEVFYEWHKKHNLFPTCYMVENSEKIEIEQL